MDPDWWVEDQSDDLLLLVANLRVIDDLVTRQLSHRKLLHHVQTLDVIAMVAVVEEKVWTTSYEHSPAGTDEQLADLQAKLKASVEYCALCFLRCSIPSAAERTEDAASASTTPCTVCTIARRL